MALSHHCVGCGADLSAIRARLDDLLRLPVVVCAGCGRAATRQPPSGRALRRARRAGLALSVLAVQALLLVAATVGALYAGAELADAIAILRRGDRLRWYPLDGIEIPWIEWIEPTAAIATPLLVLLCVGIWHGISFAHLRRVRALLGFVAWLIAAVATLLLLEALDARHAPYAHDVLAFALCFAGLAAGSVALIAGMELGRTACRRREVVRVVRWRRALAARRRRR